MKPDAGVHTRIAHELGVFLRRATRMHERRADRPADPSGLGLERAAYQLLARLIADGPGRLSALAADMGVDLSVVSRQVTALEAGGLVTRTPDPGDRRASLIAASDLGREVFGRKRDQFVAQLRDRLADWTPAERAEFARLLGRFNGAMAAHDEGK